MRHLQILKSGLTQEMSGKGNGLAELQQKLSREFPDVHTELFEWDHSDSDIEQWIRRYHEGGYLGFAGYSYGGHGAAKICKRLDRGESVTVNHLTLIDAVYGGGSWLWTTRGIAQLFHGWFEIKVPDNVETYSVYRQETDWPYGHRVTASKAKIINDAVLKTGHTDMDNAPRAHRDVISGIRDYFSKETS